MLKLCQSCRGRKETMGAGMITTNKCTTCLGVGHVETEDKAAQEVVEDIKQEVIKKPRKAK